MNTPEKSCLQNSLQKSDEPIWWGFIEIRRFRPSVEISNSLFSEISAAVLEDDDIGGFTNVIVRTSSESKCFAYVQEYFSCLGITATLEDGFTEIEVDEISSIDPVLSYNFNDINDIVVFGSVFRFDSEGEC